MVGLRHDRGASLDAVLGLSLTSTAVGWVVVEGHGAAGAIVDQADFEVCTGGATHAISTSERATADVLRTRAVLAQQDRRLHLIGVTWSDDAAAEAALLLESLTDAGFDNLVPIRLLQASERAARGIAPAAGHDKTAGCVLALAPLALAHGAALACAQSTGFAESHVGSIGGNRVARRRPYAGALTVLVGAAATFVVSVSLAVGPRLLTRMAPGPVEHEVHRSMPSPVAEAPAWPPVAAPTPQPLPDSAPPEQPAAAGPSYEPSPVFLAELPNNDPAAESEPPPEEQSVDPPPPEPEPDPHPLLTRLLERLRGQNNDPAPDAGGPAP